MSENTDKTSQNKARRRDFYILALMVISVIIVWWVSYIITIYYITSLPFQNEVLDKNLDRSSKIGDLFGSINALFSALAFAGLFFTIYLQRKESIEAREEFIQLYKAQQSQNKVSLNALRIEELKALIDAAKLQAEFDPTLQEKSHKQIIDLVGEIVEISKTLKEEISIQDNQ